MVLYKLHLSTILTTHFLKIYLNVIITTMMLTMSSLALQGQMVRLYQLLTMKIMGDMYKALVVWWSTMGNWSACKISLLSATSTTWTALRQNLCPHSEKPATQCLNNGMALILSRDLHYFLHNGMSLSLSLSSVFSFSLPLSLSLLSLFHSLTVACFWQLLPS